MSPCVLHSGLSIQNIECKQRFCCELVRTARPGLQKIDISRNDSSSLHLVNPSPLVSTRDLSIQVHECQAGFPRSPHVFSLKLARALRGITQEILAYNKQMESFAGRSEVAVGVGSVNMWGGIFHEENKTSELRDLYRMYLAENIKDGLFTEEAVRTTPRQTSAPQ